MARILILDDDASVRDSLALLLESAGHEVKALDNGSEAAALSGSEKVDLLITDMLMPGTDGVEVIKEIRRAGNTLPIIAISGGAMLADDYYLNTAKRFGADMCLEKPVNAAKLLQAIDQILAHDTVWE